MEPAGSETSPSRDYRVDVTTKKAVVEQMNKYKEVLRAVLEGQPEVAEETKQLLVRELLANFEAAVQVNVLVNGQRWDEAPDENAEEVIPVESLLDDTIVETTRRRRRYPKEILPYVVRSLKAERKLMGLYEGAVKPQEAVKDAGRESIMSSLSAAAPGMVKQTIQVMKSISALQKQAEGLCQVLDMRPSHASLEIHREVFGRGGQSDAPPPPAAGSRQPIKRAAEDAAASYRVPPSKKTDGLVGNDE